MDDRGFVDIHPVRLQMSNAYLLEGDQGLVLVDAGLRGEQRKIIRKMEALGHKRLQLIYITHAHLDHYGAAAALRRITKARIAIHHQDAEPMAHGATRLGSSRNLGRLMKAMLPLANPLLRPEPVAADILLDDGDSLDEFGLAAEVLFTPGHTLGSTTLFLNSKIAFAGDLVTNSDRPRLQRYFAEDWSLLRGSLNRLKSREPELVYTGHGSAPIQLQELYKI